MVREDIAQREQILDVLPQGELASLQRFDEQRIVGVEALAPLGFWKWKSDARIRDALQLAQRFVRWHIEKRHLRDGGRRPPTRWPCISLKANRDCGELDADLSRALIERGAWDDDFGRDRIRVDNTKVDSASVWLADQTEREHRLAAVCPHAPVRVHTPRTCTRVELAFPQKLALASPTQQLTVGSH